MTQQNLKDMLGANMATIAKLPVKNELTDLSLEAFDGYTVPITKEDYGAKTPLMWNTVYEKLGLKLRNIMVVVKEQDLERVVSVLRQDPKYLGGGVAGGYKELIIQYLDRTMPSDLSSVNIIVKEKGQLVGYNTDANGFVQSLDEKLAETGNSLKNRHVVLFGAGGVAKPVSHLLASKGIRRLTIINRTYAKAVVIAEELNRTYGPIAFGVPEDLIRGVSLNMINGAKPDVFINTTSKGMDGKYQDDASFAPAGDYNNSIALDLLRQLRAHHPIAIIADVVLTKRGKTPTLKLAELAGFPSTQLLDGVPMVINQAAPAYKLIENSHQQYHHFIKTEDDIRTMMKEAVSP